jgi:GAF domain-containing protein
LSPKQLDALKTYASQAVIAIENTRLLRELRKRTDDLSESLQQQTATSEVLQVISRSAFDLHPVFQTVAESSVRLCGADRAFIFRFDGELLRMAVAYNAPPEFAQWVADHPIKPGRHSGSERAALERRTIHIPDVRADPEYTYGAKDAETIRTVLGVPILKGDDLLGVMMIYHLQAARQGLAIALLLAAASVKVASLTPLWPPDERPFCLQEHHDRANRGSSATARPDFHPKLKTRATSARSFKASQAATARASRGR